MPAQPPTFEEARFREEQNRLLAYLPFSRPLLGLPVVTLTWRILLELTLAGNAFVRPVEPTRDDVYQFLWRLHPCFRRPAGDLPNLPAGSFQPSRWRCFLARVDCWRVSRHYRPNAIEFQIRRWLEEARQDAPRNDRGDSEVSSLEETVNQFDDITACFSPRGYLPGQILDLGVAWSLQQVRAEGLNSPDPKLRGRFISPSAALKRFENEPPAPSS
ncbi:MAG TPA: hypothetical protein VHD61_15735 [Lacunisphaera sp.]|nr:hypothetical protein [Lacunisphaera sp.]